MDHPTGKVPERVILVGLGPTKSEYMNLMASDAIEIEHDEVWGINGAGRVINVDCSFAMDDYLTCVGHTPMLAKFFEQADHPVITSIPRTPHAVQYPLQEVLSMRGARPYFDGSVSYIVAYAKMLGVTELTIFGCDYIYGGFGRMGPRQSETVSRYFACLSYWLGQCEADGMKVVVCPSSPLLNSDYTGLEQFYGYPIKPLVDMGHRPRKGREHLGGSMRRCHVDEGVLKYLVEAYAVKSLLDVGCGTGKMSDLCDKYGIEYTGVDGDEEVNPQVVHDFSTGLCDSINQYYYDLGWCVEFLEHVEEEHMASYMASFQKCHFVVVTAAPPGAPGYHHVNCQTSEYWIDKFNEFGFDFMPAATEIIRHESTMDKDFMRKTGLYFANRNWGE